MGLSVKDEGFTIVYEPDGDGEHKIDIILIHGFSGHAERTWTSGSGDTCDREKPIVNKNVISEEDTKGPTDKEVPDATCWPRDLLPKRFPMARVLTWGFNVNKAVVDRITRIRNVDRLASDLNDDLSSLQATCIKESKPLIFICHGLGGLVVKIALLDDSDGDFLPATAGIIFLGTTHWVSRYASATQMTKLWGVSPKPPVFRRFDSLKKGSDTHSSVKRYSEEHNDISKRFCDTIASHQIAIYSFEESHGLDPYHCLLGSPFEHYDVLDDNYDGIAKFHSFDDSKFLAVTGALQSSLDSLCLTSSHKSSSSSPCKPDDALPIIQFAKRSVIVRPPISQEMRYEKPLKLLIDLSLSDAKFEYLCFKARQHPVINAEVFQQKISFLIWQLGALLDKSEDFAWILRYFAASIAYVLSDLAVRKSSNITQSELTSLLLLETSPYSHRYHVTELAAKDFEALALQSSDILNLSDTDQNFLTASNYILGSDVFSNLKQNLSRLAWIDVLPKIVDNVYKDFSSAKTYNARFHVAWNLSQFCEVELEQASDIAKIMTVSGESSAAFAATCTDYIRWRWPDTWHNIVDILDHVTRSRVESLRLPHGIISINIPDRQSRDREGAADIRAHGDISYLINLAEQLGWITATFRLPRYGRVSRSDIVFERIYKCRYRIALSKLRKSHDKGSNCWHPLFKNSIIAYSFPIPHRDQEIGLELPFEAMLTLAGILYPVMYEGGILLQGVSRVLIPIARCEDSVQWHCIAHKGQSSLGPDDEKIRQISSWFKTTDLELLKRSRTFLGYCADARVHLGTNDARYQDIRQSQASREPSRVVVEREFSATAGLAHKALFTLSPKLSYAKGLQVRAQEVSKYIEIEINKSMTQLSIFYDVTKKQAWLVPEICAVLHVVHLWAARQTYIPRDGICDIPCVTVSEDGCKAAADAIMQGKGIQLIKESPDRKAMLFDNVILDVLTAFLLRKNAAHDKASKTAFKMSRKRWLCGWELLEIADFENFSERKAVTVDKQATGNWDLIAAENPDILVFFCEGLDQPIKPSQLSKVCNVLKVVPEGYDYMTTTVSCLEKLSAWNQKRCPPKITRELYWHRPKWTSLFEACGEGNQKTCDRLQRLKERRKASNPGPLVGHGAVIFGKSKYPPPSCYQRAEAIHQSKDQGFVRGIQIVDRVQSSSERCPSSHLVSNMEDPKSTVFENTPPINDLIRHTNEDCYTSDPAIMSSLANVEVRQRLTVAGSRTGNKR